MSLLVDDWIELTSGLIVLLAVYLAGTVILYKRNEIAATAWVGLLILSPLFGSLAYLLFGINRIRRRAVRMRGARSTLTAISGETMRHSAGERAELEANTAWPPARLVALTDALTTFPMTGGNAIDVHRNGDEAYPAMIAAIDGARHSVAIQSYIFRRDAVGEAFVEAMARARARGVEVRVLIDGVGDIVSLPSVLPELRRQGIASVRYLYSLWPWRMPYLNLRNHRKVMIVDGKTGFTGSMNISAHNTTSDTSARRVRDLHFAMRGPVVGHLMATFADDWQFATREALDGPGWFPDLEPAGSLRARGIPSGPHEPIERMRWVLLAGIGEARESLKIATPYFLPDETLVIALRLAALRGVAVDIILPERSNQPAVDWARTARMDELIDHGCRIWLGPAPFNHMKMMLVDEAWALVGSTNWDQRSLRLNFELSAECYDRELVARLTTIFEAEKAASRPQTLDALTNRSLGIKLRDGIARLFSPYL